MVVKWGTAIQLVLYCTHRTHRMPCLSGAAKVLDYWLLSCQKILLPGRCRLLASCDNGTEEKVLGDLPHIPFFGFQLPLPGDRQ